MGDPHDLVPQFEVGGRHAGEQVAQRVADEAPLLEAGLTGLGDAEAFGKEAGDAEHEERGEDERMLGLRLDADAVRALHVAAHDGPHDADEEDETGEIADERIGHVHTAVQELEVFGQLVVDLEHGGDTEQHEEAEVDHRVHQAGGRVAQQGAHVHTGAEVGEATLHVLRRGAAAVGGAALPVLHPVGEGERAPHQQHRDDRVEGHLQRAGDAVEHLTSDVAGAVPLGELRHDARDEREHAHEASDGDDELMGLDALGTLVGRRGRRRVRTHGVADCSSPRGARSRPQAACHATGRGWISRSTGGRGRGCGQRAMRAACAPAPAPGRRHPGTTADRAGGRCNRSRT